MAEEIHMTERKKPELLIPAGSLEVLRTAVIFGADAVYIGGEAFGLRAKAKNFTLEEMAEGIAFAHAHGVRVYVTANIFAHNDDLEDAADYFAALRDMRPEPCDALIISDPGMFAIARRVWPQAEIHISTQANNTNYQTYLFWWELGAKRVVSARELSLEEIREIRRNIPEDMEIESFVHGSMCISYSGRCLLSNYFTGRDANGGSCTHPCRWKYAVVEETRPGEYMPVYEDERGSYIFNSKDLCMIDHIPELVGAGIDSLKVEGRMKTALYTATVARVYRRAIDDYFASPQDYQAKAGWYRDEVSKCTHRQFSTGFYFGKPSEEAQIYHSSTYVNDYIYLGMVEETAEAPWGRGGGNDWPGGSGMEDIPRGVADSGLVRIEQRNKFSVGDRIEIMKPDGRNVAAVVEAMYDEAGEAMESCPHARQTVWLRLSAVPGDGEAPEHPGAAEPNDLLRVRKAG